MVDGGNIVNTENLLGSDMTEHGDLGFGGGFQRFLNYETAGNLEAMP